MCRPPDRGALVDNPQKRTEGLADPGHHTPALGHNRRGWTMLAQRLAAAVGLAIVSAAHADVLLYQNDFEVGDPGAEWSVNTHLVTSPAFSRYAGRYALAESITLSFMTPPPGISAGGEGGGSETTGGAGGSGHAFLLLFDFYCIDSWDGTDPQFGQDSFRVYINGVNQFDHAFSQDPAFHAFRQADEAGFLGYGPWRDSIYRGIAIPFDAEPSTLMHIKFRGNTTQAGDDESWGIDNVRVLYAPVPTPGSAVLMGLGGVMLLRRRRRA
jgi:hypothetical protein